MGEAVIDTSVLVRGYFDIDCQAEALRVLAHYEPVLLNFLQFEFANVLWKYARAGFLLSDGAHQRLDDLRGRFAFAPSEPLVPVALSLAMQHRHPVYDCLYVAAALDRRVPLATADKKLADTFGGQLDIPILNLHDLPETLP